MRKTQATAVKATSQNRPKTEVHRLPRTAYRPGESGNPGGRPKLTAAQRIAQEMRGDCQPEIVEKLLTIIRDPGTETRDRIVCLKALLEELPKHLEVEDVTPPEKRQASRRELIALGLGALEQAIAEGAKERK